MIGYAFAFCYILFMEKLVYGAGYFSVFVSAFVIALLIYSVLCHTKTNTQEGLVGFFGFFYACFLLSHIFLVREYTHGKLLIWLAFIAAFGCDTGAYFTGVAIGKHKLIPALSPKKTIEGSVGGILTATLLSVGYGMWINKYYPMEDVNVLLLCALTDFFGSFLAQIGDLAASSIKRQTGIKDYGKLIPGHGGVLDRFDSMMIVGPLAEALILLIPVAVKLW